jgi:putative transposase
MIAGIHAGSRGSCGSPRVRAELCLGLGVEVNRKRAGRLMREAGLQGIYRRRGRRNLVNQATEEDLVRRQFTVAGPDRLWLTDITGHPTGEGKLYCAGVMDAYSRRIIGWSIDQRQDTDLVTGALGMAVTRRQPAVIPRSCIPATALSILRGRSGEDSLMPGCSVPWARSVIVTTMR